MFKIVKSATYSAMKNEIESQKAAILVLNENLNDAIQLRDNYIKECKERGNKIGQLTAQNEACKALRDQLDQQISKLKSDLAKQGDELVTKTDEVKQLKRSLDSAAQAVKDLKEANVEYDKTFKDMTETLKDRQKQLELEYNQREALVKAINEAITEMRKTRKGRTSQNNVRAFEILKAAIGQK